jgi:hypothetical protein
MQKANWLMDNYSTSLYSYSYHFQPIFTHPESKYYEYIIIFSIMTFYYQINLKKTYNVIEREKELHRNIIWAYLKSLLQFNKINNKIL